LRAIEALLEQRERADGELVFQNRRGRAQDSSCVTDALKVALDRAALSRDMKNSPPSPPRGPLSRGYGLRATTGSEVYSKNAPGPPDRVDRTRFTAQAGIAAAVKQSSLGSAHLMFGPSRPAGSTASSLLVVMSFAVTGRLAQVVTPHVPRLPRGDASCSSVQGFASGFLPTYLAVRRLPSAGNQHHLFFQMTFTFFQMTFTS
jgi:hypothetical protein